MIDVRAKHTRVNPQPKSWTDFEREGCEENRSKTGWKGCGQGLRRRQGNLEHETETQDARILTPSSSRSDSSDCCVKRPTQNLVPCAFVKTCESPVVAMDSCLRTCANTSWLWKRRWSRTKRGVNMDGLTPTR